MKILLTVHQFLPDYSFGTEILTRDTGIEMLSRNHEVHVLTADPKSSGDSLDVRSRDYEHRGLKVHSVALPAKRSNIEGVIEEYDNKRIESHLDRYIGDLSPDVVHMFHLLRFSGVLVDVIKDFEIPLVYTPTDFWAVCARGSLTKISGELCTGPNEISSNCLECRRAERWFPPRRLPEGVNKDSFYRSMALQSRQTDRADAKNMDLVRAVTDRTNVLADKINSVDAILAPTEIMHQMLTSNSIHDDLVRISPYGMNTSSFGVLGRSRANDSLRLGYIGAINAPKGLKTLLTAFELLPENKKTITLRVCGNLNAHPEYAREVYEQAAGDRRINFAGSFPNDRMNLELSKIDVLVVPSIWYENAPLVIYSALASGVPVVASNLGGMAAAVRHEENGLLFNPGDSEDLCRQINRLIEEPKLLPNLIENTGNVRTVSDSVDEMFDLYSVLLGRSGSVSPEDSYEKRG